MSLIALKIQLDLTFKSLTPSKTNTKLALRGERGHSSPPPRAQAQARVAKTNKRTARERHFFDGKVLPKGRETRPHRSFTSRT